MDAFILKKIFSNLVQVVPGAFILPLMCIALLRVFPHVAQAGLLVITLTLLAISSPPVSNRIVNSLESRYSVMQSLPEDTALVVVLGLGHHWVADRPPNGVLMAGALSRVTEGVRLWHTRPAVYLMLSGAKFLSEISHAEAMSNMALALGVSESQIVLAPETLDTHDEVDTAQHCNGCNTMQQRMEGWWSSVVLSICRGQRLCCVTGALPIPWLRPIFASSTPPGIV